MITCQPVFERWLMDGAVLIEPVDRPGLLRLEGSGAALWDVVSAAPEGIDEDDLVRALATEYAVAPDLIRPDVETAVAQLLGHGAVRRG